MVCQPTDVRWAMRCFQVLLPVIAAQSWVATAIAEATGADDFDWRATVRVQGAGPLHSVVLPAQAYSFARSASLADLRLFNGAGESIPFAFDQVEKVDVRGPTWSVTAVPLRQFETASDGGELPVVILRHDGRRLNLEVQGGPPSAESGRGRAVAWYIDLGTAVTPNPHAYRALTLHPSGGNDYQASVTLEGSDDLRHWQMLARQTPLLRVSREALRIQHDRIEFTSTRLRYLRLSWPSALASVNLESVEIEGEPEAGIPDWQTLQLPGKARSEGGATVVGYESPAPIPTTRLRLVLPLPNTLAPVRVESRRSESDPWTTRLDATFYRLAPNVAGSPEVGSSSQSVAGGVVHDRHWQVRIDRRAGDFGSQPPLLELGWAARRVVFAARGDPPYVLAVGRPRLNGAALPLGTLVPGYRADQPLAASPATLDAATIRSAEHGWLDEIDPKQGAMWAALVLVVAVLGALAWRLLRSPDKG